MESWFIYLVSLCVVFLLKSLFSLLFPSKSTKETTAKLPPGPPPLPIIGNLLLLIGKPFFELAPILSSLSKKYGHIISLKMWSQPLIFISTYSLAYQALVQKGAIFADRPSGIPTNEILSNKRKDINTAPYGSIWRVLRRNLRAGVLQPSCIKSSSARKTVLEILINVLQEDAKQGQAACPIGHFQHALFHLMVLMCFGNNVDDNEIRKIKTIEHQLLVNLSRFSVFTFWPRITKIVFRNRWIELQNLLQSQDEAIIPIIRGREKWRQERRNKFEKEDEENVVCYVDTLLDLQLPEEKGKLEEGDIVSLCVEFVNSGSDTTMTALQWIMANLVKYPHIQARLFAEINGVVEAGEYEIKEDDLEKIPYLKAVVLEGLRRHPPVHIVFPHAVTEEVALEGYIFPKNSTVIFLASDIGRDPKVWENPMEFKPERFLNSNVSRKKMFDIMGNKEIKMMPFGEGRRMCPGYKFAILILEYFVANLVWHFEWKSVDEDGVDLTEKQETTVVMKNPLRAYISPRFK